MLAVRSRTCVPRHRRFEHASKSLAVTAVTTIHCRDGIGMTATYASPSVRDSFLNSLESTDHSTSVQLARALLGCGNPLPGITCTELGLPSNSTYDCAARRVLALYSVDASGRQA
jgi:hypothetical protein